MLRHPLAVSDFDEFSEGNSFQEVLDDLVAPKSAKRLLFCTGKLYYDLLKEKEDQKKKDVAIVRIEQLYPFPQKKLDAIIKKYNKAEKFWVQEESANMGAWDYLMRYWRKMDIELISRSATASPATGFKKVHDKQQADLTKRAIG